MKLNSPDYEFDRLLVGLLERAVVDVVDTDGDQATVQVTGTGCDEQGFTTLVGRHFDVESGEATDREFWVRVMDIEELTVY